MTNSEMLEIILRDGRWKDFISGSVDDAERNKRWEKLADANELTADEVAAIREIWKM